MKQHQRFGYSPITQRPDHAWPNGARLAVYIGFNLEHFAFGEGLGAQLAPPAPGIDVLNHAWRDYGNRVGAWRCLDLFNELGVPTSTLINTALYDHCPALVAAFAARGDELVGHGHTNSEAQGAMSAADELRLLQACRDRIHAESGVRPAGWLSPWISESADTPDLLAQAGYRYTLNWCHDDQPTRMATTHGPLWAVPYPQELNDIPAIVGRRMTGPQFAQMIVDQFDEMLEQSLQQPLVMGIALHPYIVGQPHRLRPLRQALQHIQGHRDEIWWTTAGAICEAAEAALT